MTIPQAGLHFTLRAWRLTKHIRPYYPLPSIHFFIDYVFKGMIRLLLKKNIKDLPIIRCWFYWQIYIVSIFVFCLFSLGQAAPVIEEISSVSTRELASLDTRGFLDLFRKKLDPETQKHVDAVSVSAECQEHTIASKSQALYQDAVKSLQLQLKHADKEKKPVQDEFKKRIKDFSKKIKSTGKTLKGHEDKLKKLGVKDATTHCHNAHHGHHSESDSEA